MKLKILSKVFGRLGIFILKIKPLTIKLENGTFSMNNHKYQLALKLFTDVIEEDPKWAEGWNKRATIVYLMGNYKANL